MLKLLVTYPDTATTYTAMITPISVNIEAEMGEPSTLTATIDHDYDRYYNESSTTNPLVVNSYVQLLDDATVLWRGFVYSRNILPDSEGGHISLYCLDPMGKLNDTIALLGPTPGSTTGEVPMFARTTPGAQITEKSILLADHKIGTIPYSYMFAPFSSGTTVDTAVWLDDAYVNHTHVGTGGWTDIATTLKAVGDFNGMLPAGFIRCEDEWIQYDGYTEDTNGIWYFHNCHRGALGTSAAAHSANESVYQCVAKKLHHAYPIIIEGLRDDHPDDTWQFIDGGMYTAQVEEGRFDFTSDPVHMIPADATTGSYEYSEFRVTCGVFNETAAGTVKLHEAIEDLFLATVTDGGPAMTSGTEFEVDFGDIRLTRIVADQPRNVLDTIRQLLDEVGLMRGTTEDAIGFWYDHANGKVMVHSITQAADPDHTYIRAASISEDVALEDLYSAVLVKYNTGADYNLVSSPRAWHPETSAVHDAVWLLDEATGWQTYLNVIGNLLGTYWPDHHHIMRTQLTDGRHDTGWGYMWTAGEEPAADTATDVLEMWFPDEAGQTDEKHPDTYIVDKVRVVLDLREEAQAAHDLRIDVLGMTGFTYALQGPTKTAIQLSGALTVVYEAGANLKAQNIVELKAENINIPCQGILVRVTNPQACTLITGISGQAASTEAVLIREVEVYGHQTQTKLIRLSNAYSSTYTGDVMYSATYNKLVNDNSRLNWHKTKIVDVGTSTDMAALSLGRLALQAALFRTQIKTAVIDYDGAPWPELGDTVRFPDNFTGVLLGKSVEFVGGNRIMTLRAIDFEPMRL